MPDRLNDLDLRLLGGFQRDFPLLVRPFARIGECLGLGEAEVLARLAALRETGRIARVGATVRPNTIGASTLAALSIPDERIEEVAARVSAEAGVNHSYLREHDRNLWFVATAPDGAALAASLDGIRRDTGLDLLDLRLVRPFNIDLGFALSGPRDAPAPRGEPDLAALRETDRPILHALTQGLALVPRPFAQMAHEIGLEEEAVIARIAALLEAGILTRIGIIVRHRAVGWSANAMVVWDVPETAMGAAGTALAALPGVTLCYQRQTIPGRWDYGLFSMIHARSRPEAQEVLGRATLLPELAGARHETLFSVRCFKQTGAQIARPAVRAA
ncbi:Lrp/AsnC family transcriptional regulator [Tropicimonas sp.]|uniref:siroheme decarboxylase subunit beta n=1 Tax=Tropicimonas sp. TaxID=2067044 RepID=UPI003A880802